ncbi:hypothetical protein LTR09_003561 [Extremus antarcticus]|uniref:Uncharacterized protein n=1 Tax=Extremus antarcticus TaxID=702011 RepID=A0AAJ0GBE5_9PEZI|nr:hypothetical protein LTR09_003561 [Extremus antarcticus]
MASNNENRIVKTTTARKSVRELKRSTHATLALATNKINQGVGKGTQVVAELVDELYDHIDSLTTENDNLRTEHATSVQRIVELETQIAATKTQHDIAIAGMRNQLAVGPNSRVQIVFHCSKMKHRPHIFYLADTFGTLEELGMKEDDIITYTKG